MNCKHCGGGMFFWENAGVWVCGTCPEGLDDAVICSGVAMIADIRR